MNYKDLRVWQEARVLNKAIYQVTKSFPKEEMFGLSNQMRRCTISIMSNIAEGKGRSSPKELLYFINIAKGSCSEIECQIIAAEDIGFIGKELSLKLQEQSLKIIKMLAALSTKIKT